MQERKSFICKVASLQSSQPGCTVPAQRVPRPCRLCLVQLNGEQGVGWTILPRKHRVAERVQAIDPVPETTVILFLSIRLCAQRHLGHDLMKNRMGKKPPMTAAKNILPKFVCSLLFVLQHLIPGDQGWCQEESKTTTTAQSRTTITKICYQQPGDVGLVAGNFELVVLYSWQY